MYKNLSIAIILFVLHQKADSQRFRGRRQEGGYAEVEKPKDVYGPPGHTPGEPLGPSAYTAESRMINNFTSSPGPSPYCLDKTQNPAANKASVLKFYEELFSKKNFQAIEKYIGPMYIQHNPMTLDGKDKLLESLNGTFWQALTGYQIYRISAEDDLVWVQDRMDFGNKSYVFLDILRFECGKIVEHWDVIQRITGMEINPHAFF